MPSDPGVIGRGLAAWLSWEKPEGQGLARSTVVEYCGIARRFWEWAARRWRRFVPPAPEFTMQRPGPGDILAPTWAQMDAVILATRGRPRDLSWLERLLTLCRFTGLRVGQANRLRWDDFDIERAALRIRPELGKSANERQGRVVPVSRHLIRMMAGWGRREGAIVGKGRIIYPTLHSAIDRAEIPAEVWQGHPTHMFRRGFISRLVQIADVWAVGRLVGHRIAVGESAATRHYLDQTAVIEKLRPTVDLVPPMTTVLAAAKSKAG